MGDTPAMTMKMAIMEALRRLDIEPRPKELKQLEAVVPEYVLNLHLVPGDEECAIQSLMRGICDESRDQESFSA